MQDNVTDKWEQNLRGNQKRISKSTHSMKIRIVDWQDCDETIVEKTKNKQGKEYKRYDCDYVIRIFGVTKSGTSICAHVTGYIPHFYVSVPEIWKREPEKLMEFKLKIHQILKLGYQKTCPYFIKASFVKREKFYGFTDNKLFLFVKLEFRNKRTMSKLYRCLKEDKIMNLDWTNRIYEADIPPFLRFIHEQNIQPAMWIKIDKNNYNFNFGENKKSRCQFDVDVEWSNVKHYECFKPAPFIISSFDLECDSSHGDFPLAVKTMRKTASEIVDVYHKYKFNEKSNDEQITFIIEIFQRGFFYNWEIPIISLPSYLQDISQIFTKEDAKPTESLIKDTAINVVKFMNAKQNYELLAEDVIKNIIQDNTLHPNGNIFIGNQITELLFEAFADENMKESEKYNNIRLVYTRGNHKPTRANILKCSSIIKKHISNRIKYIRKMMDDNEDDVDDDNDESDENKIRNIFENYESFYQRKLQNNKKFDEIYNYIDIFVRQIAVVFNKYLPDIDDTRDANVRRLVNIFPILKELDDGEKYKKSWNNDSDNESESETDIMDSYNPNIHFPPIRGDKIIQIGTVSQKYGENTPFLKHIITLNTCDKIEGCVVESYDTEEECIIAWINFIIKLDPDIITGYNIFGFDFAYIWRRAEELNICSDLKKIGRLKHIDSYLGEKELSSSALGDNYLYFVTMLGRSQIDLLKVIQRDHKLLSYKLDSVAEHFINDNVRDINVVDNEQHILIDGANTLIEGNFITFKYKNSDKKQDYVGTKFKIKNIGTNDDNTNWVILDKYINPEILFDNTKTEDNVEWQLAKDDVSPKQIFEFQKQNSEKRCIIATYCIQDCALCLTIINKLDLLTCNISMANVCCVPLSFIFLRGQGIKILSLVSKECKNEGFLLPVLRIENQEKERKIKKQMRIEMKNLKFTPNYETSVDNYDGYEGAIVLHPKPAIYTKPIPVLDYSSLYPSSMISENISHDSYATDEEWLGDEGKKRLSDLGYNVNDITYDIFQWIDPNIKSKGKKITGKKTCRFVERKDGTKHLIPRILMKLLKARKDTRVKLKNETNAFMKGVYDGLQLAFKQTGNSLYGGVGSLTSAISNVDLAACTTATGRRLLFLAKSKVESHFKGAEIIYGDTDSIFINFNPKDKDGIPLEGREALVKSIELGIEAEKYIQTFLKKPHVLEYEKTIWPFILFTKKRYIGNVYKTNPDEYKRTSMGIVLKRRDNANIVKHVYGGIIDIIMDTRDLQRSIKFCKTECNKLLRGKIKMDMLIVTKSLKGYYKNPRSIAHKVLADRIGDRDPGNKPKSNDRIPYVYIEKKASRKEKILQGDKIEHPQYIRDNNIKPDYLFYLTNQLMKPIGQIYALVVESLDGYTRHSDYYIKKRKSLLIKYDGNESKVDEKIRDLRHKDACDIIFKELIRIYTNKKEGRREIIDFFKSC